jgi:DNA polymerase
MMSREQQYYLQQMGLTVWKEQQQTADSLPTEGWDKLKQEVAACTQCSLCITRTQTVFGVGNAHAQLMIIGEAPGANEDRLGEPFVGRAGQLLDAMLAAIDLSRQDVYICNILKCRPPNNRDPAPEEVAKCTPFLERQIDWVQPKLILALGRIAAHYLLGVDTPLGRLRGQSLKFGQHPATLLVTYHPAYLLRNPADKAKAYQDFQRVQAYLLQSATSPTTAVLHK